MNLNEYEKTKKECDKIIKDGGYPYDLIQQLLQYRRENNIFEVGDSVVLIGGYTDKVHYLSGWYIDGLDFRYTTNPSGWGVIVKSSMPNVWRHATDEELKEGKRL